MGWIDVVNSLNGNMLLTPAPPISSALEKNCYDRGSLATYIHSVRMFRVQP